MTDSIAKAGALPLGKGERGPVTGDACGAESVPSGGSRRLQRASTVQVAAHARVLSSAGLLGSYMQPPLKKSR